MSVVFSEQAEKRKNTASKTDKTIAVFLIVHTSNAILH